MDTHDSDSENDEKLYNLKRIKDNEISKYEQCVTNASDMRQFALYEDDEGRLYRPRVYLTKQANSLESIVKDQSEKVIVFDVYLLPAPRERKTVFSEGEVIKKNTKRQKREKPKRFEKADPLKEADRITLFLRKDRESDKISVKKFTVIVQESKWGNLVVRNKRGVIEVKQEENFGMVTVVVDEIFSRSLIIRPEFELMANLYDLPS